MFRSQQDLSQTSKSDSNVYFLTSAKRERTNRKEIAKKQFDEWPPDTQISFPIYMEEIVKLTGISNANCFRKKNTSLLSVFTSRRRQVTYEFNSVASAHALQTKAVISECPKWRMVLGKRTKFTGPGTVMRKLLQFLTETREEHRIVCFILIVSIKGIWCGAKCCSARGAT